jgi:hypothetical protein
MWDFPSGVLNYTSTVERPGTMCLSTMVPSASLVDRRDSQVLNPLVAAAASSKSPMAKKKYKMFLRNHIASYYSGMKGRTGDYWPRLEMPLQILTSRKGIQYCA